MRMYELTLGRPPQAKAIAHMLRSRLPFAADVVQRSERFRDVHRIMTARAWEWLAGRWVARDRQRLAIARPQREEDQQRQRPFLSIAAPAGRHDVVMMIRPAVDARL